MKQNKIVSVLVGIIKYTILVVAAIATLFPLTYTFLSSFKTNLELMAYPGRLFPEKFMFSNIGNVLNSDSIKLGTGVFNSLWYSVGSVVIGLFSAALCGYVFARGSFKAKKPLFAIFSALMFISMGSITVYPQLKIVSFLGLDKSLAGLLAVKLFGIPIVEMYIMKGFVESIPRELDEAAKIDGCTFSGIFFRIIMPALKPALATLGILSFKSSWNDYFYPAIYTMTDTRKQPMMVQIMALKNSGAGASDWPTLFMASVIMILPVLVIFLIFNKTITESVTEGAIKG